LPGQKKSVKKGNASVNSEEKVYCPRKTPNTRKKEMKIILPLFFFFSYLSRLSRFSRAICL